MTGWLPETPGGSWLQGVFLNPDSYDFSLGRVTPGDTGTTVAFSTAFSDRLRRSGDVMKGPLTLFGSPGGDMDAVNKLYIDQLIEGLSGQIGFALPLLGGTMEGFLTLNADPQQPLEAATKQYVDARDAAVSAGATAQVSTVTAAAAAAQTTANAALPKAGGTLTGPLTLAGAPSGSLSAATKGYVDAAVSGGPSGLGVLKAGDTMTGLLVLSGDPSAALDAATKQYVDAAAAASTMAALAFGDIV